MKMLALLPLAIALSGCVTYHTSSDGLARAKFGETFSASGLRITPLALLEDSRCPENVQCIRAGDVRISARIDAADTELTLGKPLGIGSATVLLAEVYPGRRMDTAVYTEDYRFGFKVTR